MNYSQFLNCVSSQRKPSAIRLLTALKVQSGPSMISLAGGNPNPLLFPFKEATFKLRGGRVIHLDEEKMKVALQYDSSPGNANFVKLLKKMQKHFHEPPLFEHSDPDGRTDVCVTYGSTDGVAKSFDMLVSPGDGVLVEEPASFAILSALRPLGCKVIPVETDDKGIVPQSLLAVCKEFCQTPSSRVKFLYTVPNGRVPSGASTSSERRKEIYKIAGRFGFLILEHDPFYMLQYSKVRKPSYLSLDEDGRVLRFDSFSSLLSPGMRVGYVTGPRALVDRVVLHLMVSSMHVPTFSQVLINEFLDEVGLDGYERHACDVSDVFEVKRNAVLTSAGKWLGGLAEWTKPEAGTCLWMKLKTKSTVDVEKLLNENSCLTAGHRFGVNSQRFCQHVLVEFGDRSVGEVDEELQALAEKIK